MGALGSAETVENLTRVRRLRRHETRVWSSHIAHAWGPNGGEIVVVERFPATMSDTIAIGEQARRLLGVLHPNMTTVRRVGGPDVTVVSDYVEGERLDALRTASEVPLDVSMRILIDVFAALSAMHDLGIVHGHVEPANVIVGLDGVSRLVRGYIGPGRLLASQLATHRVAPEVLQKQAIDLRADVYGAGALLKDMLLASQPAWGVRLASVVVTAMSNSPRDRYPTISDMARALRLAARSHVASPSRVADHVDNTAGDRIIARRGELAVPSERRILSSRPSIPSARPQAMVAPAGTGTTAILRARVRRWSRLWIATVAIVLALAGVVVWLLVHARTPVAAPAAMTATPPTTTSAAPDNSKPAVDDVPEPTSTQQPQKAKPSRPTRKPARVDRSSVF